MSLDWYHTLELPDGTVTPGWFDCRPIVARVPLPASLAGARALDVGTWDGFWAFELERRGAAEVVALDVAEPGDWDWPPQARSAVGEAQQAFLAGFKAGDRAFAHARAALASRVERVELSVYDLSPERVGTFDFAYLGTLLMHLRDPVRALAALRGVVRGEAVIADGVDLLSTLTRPRTPLARLEGLDRPWWWQPNRAGLLRMIQSAGWEVLERTGVWFMPLGAAHPRPPLTPGGVARALASARGRERLVVRLLGVPHVAVRVRAP